MSLAKNILALTAAAFSMIFIFILIKSTSAASG